MVTIHDSEYYHDSWSTIALTLATGHKHLILNKWSNPKTF